MRTRWTPRPVAPAFPPYTIKVIRPDRGRRPIKVGILGLTNPGIAIWDKANVEGKMTFDGLVEQAKRWVPWLRPRVDVLLVAAHSGADTSSSYGDALPYPENASTLVAQQVPGIDAILVGHAHLEIPQRIVTNTATNKPVVLSEPLKWGERLTVFDVDLNWDHRHGWQVQTVALPGPELQHRRRGPARRPGDPGGPRGDAGPTSTR